MNKKQNSPFISIKTKIITLFVCLVLIGVTVLGFIFYNDTIYVLSEQTKQDATINLEQDKRIITNTLNIYSSYLIGLTENSLLINSLVDIETQKSALKVFMRDLKMPGNQSARISMTNFKGDVLASNSAIASDIDEQWLDTVMKGLYYSGTVLKNNKVVLIQALPIYYNQLVEGMLVAEIDLDFFKNVLTLPSEGDHLSVVDLDNQLVLFGHDQVFKESILTQLKDLSDEVTIENDDHIIVSQRLNHVRDFEIYWLIVDVTSKKRLTELVHGVRHKYILGALIAIFVISIAVYIFSSNLLKPVLLLMEHVKKINSGQVSLDDQFVGIDSNDEIESLAKSFEFMRRQLNESQNKLEEKVRSRTRSLEESEARLRTIIESYPSALVMVNIEGDMVFVNPKMEKYFGYHKDELIGQKIEMLLPAQLRDKHTDFRNAFNVNPTQREMGSGRKLFGIKKDGSQLPLEIALTPVFIDGQDLVLATIVDITNSHTLQEKLEESKRRYSLANQTAKVGIWDWNVKTNELIWDDVMYELYGIKESDFSGAYEAWQSAIYPDDKAKTVENLDQCVKGFNEYDVEFRVVWPDQTIHYIRAYGQVIKNDNGDVVRVIGTNWDITKTKQLEQETQMILNNVPAYIYYKDSENKILRLNEPAAHFMGLKVEDVQGRQTEEFFDPEMAQKYFEDDMEVFSSKKPKLDIIEEMKLQDGASLWIKTDKIPIADDSGNFNTILVVATDITTIKKYQFDLERSNQELEQFAYVASHDLQEPIRKIVGFVQLLENHLDQTIDEKSREYMDYAVDGAKRMQKLIQDLLQYSRTGSSELSCQDVDINDVIEEVKSNLELSIEETKAIIKHKELPTIRSNRNFLVRLFQNLIGNALKYKSDLDPVIEIYSERINHQWVFSIIDNGIGIDQEHADRIFIIFQRLHGKAHYSGTGIGLAICRRIVERLGGRIWLEQPKNGNGSVFKFTLPISQS